MTIQMVSMAFWWVFTGALGVMLLWMLVDLILSTRGR